MLDFLKNAHSGGDSRDLSGREKRRKELAQERRRLLADQGGDPHADPKPRLTKKARELNEAANTRRKKMGLPPLKAEDVKVFRNGGAVMKARGGTFKGTF